MSIDDKINHCRLEYQRFMDDEEKKRHKGQNAFCLVEDDKCPYHASFKIYNYCRYDCRVKQK